MDRNESAMLQNEILNKWLKNIAVFSTETMFVMWPNLFTVCHWVGAYELIATLGSKRQAHQTLFENQSKSRST